ncbi:hypothetical protein [Mesorhizobium xinjiangense]|uniref:hypothetical protein n=1 Tax=Mesorhizobium xinjiangense TaxID=2678685 RepID=UPI0012ED4470|nr:hypothetical protein [Mesorhizobium xinjiangense]
MKKIAIFVLFVVTVGAPGTAFAYVGPGAGLSLLGALWALVAAIATALIFVLAWPIRRMMRRRRAQSSTRATDGQATLNSDHEAREKNRAG